MTVKNNVLVILALAALLLFPCACAPDESPPVIQSYEVPKWVVENEDIVVNVNASDDQRVKRVYIQFDNGNVIPLEKTKDETQSWKTSFKLPSGDYNPGVYDFSIIASDGNNEARTDGNKISVYPDDYDKDGIGYRDELKYGLDSTKKNPVAKYLLDKNLGSYIPKLSVLENDGTIDENKKAFVDLLPTMSKEVFEDIGFIYENGRIGNQEIDFLKSQGRDAQKLFKSYIDEIYEVNPELAMKLGGIDEFGTIELKDLKAAKRIRTLASNPEYKTALESIAKHSSSSRGLVWITYDYKPEEVDHLLKDYSLVRFLDFAWEETTTSDNFKNSEIWGDFDTVVKTMFDSPEAISAFMVKNIYWKNYMFGMKNPLQVFECIKENKKKDMKCAINCFDAARFAKYGMVNNIGYITVNNEIDFKQYDSNVCGFLGMMGQIGSGGHVVCLYKEDKLYYYFNHRGPIIGPYKTIKEAAESAALIVGGLAGYEISDYGEK